MVLMFELGLRWPETHNHGIELCLSWRPDYGGHYPKDEALSAGSNLFVIRAKDECAGNNWVPGKLQVDANLDRPYAYISYNNYAIPVENYEVLTCSAMPGFGCGHSWVPVDDDNWSLPTALIAGADEKGLLFVARGKIQGEMCVGKYSPGREAALVPWHGEERQLEEFEVLVFNSRSY